MSQSLAGFGDSKRMPNAKIAIDVPILRSMRARPSASVFTPKHFSLLGKPEAVRQALSRLTRAGKIRRIRRGLYDLPREHPIIGQVAPDPMAAVRALMEGSRAQWQVSGAYAANLLGLSEQVPAKIVILTDGVPRRVMLGKMTLQFRRAAPRYMLGVGRGAGLVFQGLRHLGPKNVTGAHLRRLHTNLDQETKDELRKLAPHFPRWMQSIVAQVIDVKTPAP
jgi:hypothetical protein